MQRSACAVAIAALAAAVGGCSPDGGPAAERPPSPTGSTTASTTAASAAPATVVAVGDIGNCDGDADEAVAALAAASSGPVLLLGDIAYPNGTAEDFTRCFDPAWGGLRERLRPAPGNHDYNAGATAPGYSAYFGVPRWYEFDVGGWHVLSLNSNCALVGGCGAGSEQERWLRAALARRTDGRCTLAYWHHARFSSGSVHGSNAATAGLWRALADAGADVVLVGHEHVYERFAPLDPGGAVDRERGMRQFVVGTGGRSHYGFEAPLPGSEVREHRTFGVLELTLHPDRYEWRFVPVAGGEFTDEGEDRCR